MDNMIQIDKHNKALRSVQDLITKSRSLAYENYPYEGIADLMDRLEYLPALILEDKDRTELFESHLFEMCKKYHCVDIYERYQK